MNWHKEFKTIVDNYTRSLQFSQNKTKSKAERDEAKRMALTLYFGLEGTKYSKEEISIITELSEERIRQIIKESLIEINSLNNNKNEVQLFKEKTENIDRFIQELESVKVWNYNLLLNHESNRLNISIEEIDPYLQLFIATKNYSLNRIHLHHLSGTELVFTENQIIKKNFIKLCYTVYLIIEKNILPINEMDLLLRTKKKYKNEIATNENILLCPELIPNISIVRKGSKTLFQIDFHRLSSTSDMAYRVLFENGERMKLAEVLKEINHRIQKHKDKKVNKISLNSQMNMDKRLLPLGKSGVWSLKEWNDSNKTMYDLISETLTLFNKPLTKKEIFSNIQKSRPNIPTRSLDTVIYNERFKKLKSKSLFKHSISTVHKVTS